jgi:hypothetical protein
MALSSPTVDGYPEKEHPLGYGKNIWERTPMTEHPGKNTRERTTGKEHPLGCANARPVTRMVDGSGVAGPA